MVDITITQPSFFSDLSASEEKATKYVSELLERSLSNEPSLELDYKVDSANHFVLRSGHVSSAFHFLSPESDEREEEEQEKRMPIDQRGVNRAISSMIDTVERQVPKIESRYQDIIEPPVESVFDSSLGIMKYNPKTDTIVFDCQDSPPKMFYTHCMASDQVYFQLYTIVGLMARSWIRSTTNKRYIQLAGHVRCGWDRLLDGTWIEPTGFSVNICPKSGGCSLDLTSVPSNPVYSNSDIVKRIESNVREKGWGADLQFKLDTTPNGISITTPSLYRYSQGIQQQIVEYANLEINKMELDTMYQAPGNQVKWTLKRKFSRIQNTPLGRWDLVYPQDEMSRKEFKAISVEKAAETASTVNFGIWRLDECKNVGFAIEVLHMFRDVKRKRLFEVETKNNRSSVYRQVHVFDNLSL